MKPRRVGSPLDRPEWRPFSPGQRRALVGLLTVFLIAIAVRLLRNPTHVPDPLPPSAPRGGELLDTIDPNTADVASLSALPALGPRRAADLVAYRESVRAGDAGRVVFRSLDDLMQVRGIGYAITRQIEPYVSFPPAPATTRAASGVP